MRICVIGCGISGLAAAHYLSDDAEHQVTILEAQPVLGGRANVTDGGEHCTRVFLDDYHYLNDLLAEVPVSGGQSLFESLRPAARFAQARDGRWVPIDHIYAFLSRSGGLTLRDKLSILTSNRRSLLAAIDADRWKRHDDSPGTKRWTIRLPSKNRRSPDVTSTNRYGSLWNWSPAGLYRALRSAWSSSRAMVLSGCTERHFTRPWVEFLADRGVVVRRSCPVDRIDIGVDGVAVFVAGTTESFDLVIVAAFAHDVYGLLDRSGYPRFLDHRTHTHFKAFTIELDPREPILANATSRIFASDGISTIVQPAEHRCVCMAAYPRSTDREHVLGVVRDQLSLEYAPVRVLERDNLEPGEAVFVGDYIDPIALAAPLGHRVQFAGSCMDNSYPVDSAEGACRSAFNAVTKFTQHHPAVRIRARPMQGGDSVRVRIFPSTTRVRPHPNAPASPLVSSRSWRVGQWLSGLAVFLTTRLEIDDRSGIDWPLGRPAVYVATHRSLFDTPLGMALFRRLAVQPRLVVAAKYFNHPLGCLLRGVGALVAVRGSDATINAAVAAMTNGESVAFMIEGRLVERRNAASATHGRGAVETALRTGASLVPIAAAGLEDVWAPGTRLPSLLRRRPFVTVAIGRLIEASGPPDQLMERVRGELQMVEAMANGELSEPDAGCDLRPRRPAEVTPAGRTPVSGRRGPLHR